MKKDGKDGCMVGRGVLTLAHGERFYIRMAKALARSLRCHGCRDPLAVITDSNDPELADLFDCIVPFRPEFGQGVVKKLYLDLYSPSDKRFSSMRTVWSTGIRIRCGNTTNPSRGSV